jgi:hypothetical protein
VSFEGPVLSFERHRTVLALVFAVEFCTNAVAGVMTELSRDAEACTASPAVLSPFQCSQCVDHDQVLFVDLCEIRSSRIFYEQDEQQECFPAWEIHRCQFS